MRSPINPTDDAARVHARGLLQGARFGALAVLHPQTQAPYVARVAVLWCDGALHTLVSTLATHTAALAKHPDCAILIGEPQDKGDPLTHPRLAVTATAHLVDKSVHRQSWLDAIPKAQLYYDFADFQMYRMEVSQIDLNAGFGKAYRLKPDDLGSKLATPDN